MLGVETHFKNSRTKAIKSQTKAVDSLLVVENWKYEGFFPFRGSYSGPESCRTNFFSIVKRLEHADTKQLSLCKQK